MVELTDKLCQEKVKIGVIVQKIEIGEDYMSYVRTILPKLNQIMTEIFRLMQIGATDRAEYRFCSTSIARYCIWN